MTTVFGGVETPPPLARAAALAAGLIALSSAPALGAGEAGFSAPRSLDEVNGFVAAPAIAADGRAAVAMTDFATGRSRVVLHQRSARGRWGAPQVLRSSRQELFEPIAAFAGNEPTVGWLRARRIDQDQVLEVHRPGGVEVVSPARQRAIFPAIASPSLVGWLDGDYGVRVDGAGTLFPRRNFAFSLAQLPDGNAVALSQAFGPGGVRVRVRPPGGAWGAPVTLSGPRTAREATLATGADGTVAVAWAQYTDTGYRIQVAERPPGGEFTPARTIDPAGGEARAPALAVRPDGRLLIAWLGGAQLNFLARGTEVRLAVDGGPVRRVSAAGRRISATPQLFVDAEGDALITWEESRRVTAATRTAGGRLSSPRAVSGARVYATRVVANARGQALAAWSVERSGRALIQVAEATF